MEYIKNYTMVFMQKGNQGGFDAWVNDSMGREQKLQYSSITKEFYHAEGYKFPIPKYVQKKLIEVAVDRGYEVDFFNSIGC